MEIKKEKALHYTGVTFSNTPIWGVKTLANWDIWVKQLSRCQGWVSSGLQSQYGKKLLRYVKEEGKGAKAEGYFRIPVNRVQTQSY